MAFASDWMQSLNFSLLLWGSFNNKRSCCWWRNNGSWCNKIDSLGRNFMVHNSVSWFTAVKTKVIFKTVFSFFRVKKLFWPFRSWQIHGVVLVGRGRNWGLNKNGNKWCRKSWSRWCHISTNKENIADWGCVRIRNGMGKTRVIFWFSLIG